MKSKRTPEQQRDRDDINWALNIYARAPFAERERTRRELRRLERQFFGAAKPTVEEVLGALRALDGRAVDQRLIDKLPGGRVVWRLRTELGAIELQDRDYAATGEGVCLLLLAPGDDLVLNYAWVERQHLLRTEPR